MYPRVFGMTLTVMNDLPTPYLRDPNVREVDNAEAYPDIRFLVQKSKTVMTEQIV